MLDAITFSPTGTAAPPPDGEEEDDAVLDATAAGLEVPADPTAGAPTVAARLAAVIDTLPDFPLTQLLTSAPFAARVDAHWDAAFAATADERALEHAARAPAAQGTAATEKRGVSASEHLVLGAAADGAVAPGPDAVGLGLDALFGAVVAMTAAERWALPRDACARWVGAYEAALAREGGASGGLRGGERHLSDAAELLVMVQFVFVAAYLEVRIEQ